MNNKDFERIIGKGRDRALTLKEIMSITDMTARDVRKTVGDLQKSGVPIINLQDGTGYYVADDYKEIQKYIQQKTNRGIKNLVRANALLRYLKTNGVEPIDMITEGKLI